MQRSAESQQKRRSSMCVTSSPTSHAPNVTSSFANLCRMGPFLPMYRATGPDKPYTCTAEAPLSVTLLTP